MIYAAVDVIRQDLMRFDDGIKKKYRQSVDDAFATILAKGNDFHRQMLHAFIDSDLLIRVRPVSEINASGVTGAINPVMTNLRMATSRIDFQEALGEIYIAIAEETIDTGGQRGCECTFVHEGRHAYDFAQTIESLSNADMKPLSVFNPTLYEMEWEAHKTAGDYMLRIDQPEYVDEGLQLRILGRGEDGACFVSEDGICQRLGDSYGLHVVSNPGRLASEMMGLIV